MSWTREFPQSVGSYWFYGQPDKDMLIEPEMFLVTAVRVSGVTRVSTHGIVFDPKRVNGIFRPAVLPYPSDEEYAQAMKA